MAQMARNLTDAVDGFLLNRHFLICDRDTKFTAQFRRAVEAASIPIVTTPFQAPNCNAQLSGSSVRSRTSALVR